MSGPFLMNMSDTDRRQSFVRLALDLASIQKGEQDAPSAEGRTRSCSRSTFSTSRSRNRIASTPASTR